VTRWRRSGESVTDIGRQPDLALAAADGSPVACSSKLQATYWGMRAAGPRANALLHGRPSMIRLNGVSIATLERRNPASLRIASN
jgi:hypothetical protein